MSWSMLQHSANVAAKKDRVAESRVPAREERREERRQRETKEQRATSTPGCVLSVSDVRAVIDVEVRVDEPQPGCIERPEGEGNGQGLKDEVHSLRPRLDYQVLLS